MEVKDFFLQTFTTTTQSRNSCGFQPENGSVGSAKGIIFLYDLSPLLTTRGSIVLVPRGAPRGPSRPREGPRALDSGVRTAIRHKYKRDPRCTYAMHIRPRVKKKGGPSVNIQHLRHQSTEHRHQQSNNHRSHRNRAAYPAL